MPNRFLRAVPNRNSDSPGPFLRDLSELSKANKAPIISKVLGARENWQRNITLVVQVCFIRPQAPFLLPPSTVLVHLPQPLFEHADTY